MSVKSDPTIRRYLLGIASDHEVRELERRLRSDEGLQDQLLLEAELDAHLRQEAQLGPTDSDRQPQDAMVTAAAGSGADSPRLHTTNRVLVAVAVVAIFALLGQAMLIGDRVDEIITITSVSGPVEWTGDGGRVTDDLTVGEKLPGGTIELLAPDSWVEFAFDDQSTVTLTGLSATTIATTRDAAPEKQQKELRLRHGHLSANVRKQSSAHPMLVHTPSAELTVLGTRFDVETASESTRLTVNDGRVRLKRLTDGKVVDVPAQQSVLATLENQNRLSPSRRSPPITIWRSDLRADAVQGKWISQLWVLGGKLKKAVADGEMTREAAIKAYKKAASFDDATGGVWAAPSPFGALVVLSPRRSIEQPVTVNANTLIRVHVQTYSQAGVRIGITVRHPDGGFAGKYSTRLSPDELSNDDRPVELVLPISRFVDEKNPTGSPLGKELTDWWCVSEASSSKIGISSVEVMDRTEDAP